MPKIDAYEEEILSAHREGKLKSVATKEELAKFNAAARAIASKDRRVNIEGDSHGQPDQHAEDDHLP